MEHCEFKGETQAVFKNVSVVSVYIPFIEDMKGRSELIKKKQMQ